MDLKNLIPKTYKEISNVIVGQNYMIERMLIGLLCDGHILLEGVPGLAKTLAVKTLSEVLDLDFKRVQFTPDLLPSDLIGTVIYNHNKGDFIAKKGPIFTNVVLADEINRAPAKVQSALLEAMAERQITIGDETFKLDEPFLVLATQNPIEQEGTYPLPEAQLDRFMFKLKVTYPARDEEKIILEKMTSDEILKTNMIIKKSDIKHLKHEISKVYVDDKIKNYILDIVFKTREKDPLIEYGASPRASIYILKAARAYAFLNGRTFVIPEDVKAVVYDVLRHRIIISFEAEAASYDADYIIKQVLDKIEIP